MSKQGCHVLGLLAAVLGNRAEFLACHFLPMVLKIVAITVQVIPLTLGVRAVLHAFGSDSGALHLKGLPGTVYSHPTTKP